MDWASRRVLAWRLSNTLDTCFCLEALAEAMEGYGILEIFNTDQGSQFTSVAYHPPMVRRVDAAEIGPRGQRSVCITLHNSSG